MNEIVSGQTPVRVVAHVDVILLLIVMAVDLDDTVAAIQDRAVQDETVTANAREKELANVALGQLMSLKEETIGTVAG